MEIRHWSDDQLIAALYGAADRDQHAMSCDSCLARWDELCERQDLLRHCPEPDAAFFAAQRGRIQARLESPKAAWQMPAAALTAAAVSVLLLRTFLMPGTEPQQPLTPQVSDAQFFREVSAVVEMEAPRASEPIRALFEENE